MAIYGKKITFAGAVSVNLRDFVGLLGPAWQLLRVAKQIWLVN